MAAMPALHLVEAQRGPTALVRDRKPDRRTEVADLVDDLTAHRLEAVALVTGLLPLVAFVTSAAREVSPAHYQAAVTIAHRLRRYLGQNEDPEPEPPAVAA